jgi:hypothetical protein
MASSVYVRGLRRKRPARIIILPLVESRMEGKTK